jgi:hypothetical protein
VIYLETISRGSVFFSSFIITPAMTYATIFPILKLTFNNVEVAASHRTQRSHTREQVYRYEHRRVHAGLYKRTTADRGRIIATFVAVTRCAQTQTSSIVSGDNKYDSQCISHHFVIILMYFTNMEILTHISNMAYLGYLETPVSPYGAINCLIKSSVWVSWKKDKKNGTWGLWADFGAQKLNTHEK